MVAVRLGVHHVDQHQRESKRAPHIEHAAAEGFAPTSAAVAAVADVADVVAAAAGPIDGDQG
jgi:hypothetical protein